jgi:ankyrin repeat protein
MESQKAEAAIKAAIEYEGVFGLRRVLPKISKEQLRWQRGTAVHFAIRKLSDIETLDELLKKDPSLLEVENEDLETPLLLSIAERRLYHSRFLLSKNANVHAKNRLGRGVLHYAAFRAFNTEGSILPDLMKTDASKDLNAHDSSSSRETPLHILARSYRKGSSRVFREWINACVDQEECSLNVTDADGDTVVDLLRRRGHSKKADYVK